MTSSCPLRGTQGFRVSFKSSQRTESHARHGVWPPKVAPSRRGVDLPLPTQEAVGARWHHANTGPFAPSVRRPRHPARNAHVDTPPPPQCHRALGSGDHHSVDQLCATSATNGSDACSRSGRPRSTPGNAHVEAPVLSQPPLSAQAHEHFLARDHEMQEHFLAGQGRQCLRSRAEGHEVFFTRKRSKRVAWCGGGGCQVNERAIVQVPMGHSG